MHNRLRIITQQAIKSWSWDEFRRITKSEFVVINSDHGVNPLKCACASTRVWIWYYPKEKRDMRILIRLYYSSCKLPMHTDVMCSVIRTLIKRMRLHLTFFLLIWTRSNKKKEKIFFSSLRLKEKNVICVDVCVYMSYMNFCRYLGRKRSSNAKEPWVPGSTHIVQVDYTYWTLGYGLTSRGARKLIDSRPFSKLVPLDEFLPIMFDRHIKWVPYLYYYYIESGAVFLGAIFQDPVFLCYDRI